MPAQIYIPQRQLGDLFGTHRRQRRLGDMTLTETQYPPLLAIPRHDHRHASFCYVVEGGYDETYERHDRHCRAGAMIFHPEGEHHSDRHGKSVTRMLTVEFSDERLQRLRDVTTVLDQPIAVECVGVRRLGLTLLQEFSRTDKASALALEGLVLECLAAVQRYDGPLSKGTPGWLMQVQAFLHEHFAETCALQDIATMAGVHPMHLTRQFRRQFGCSLGDYVRHLRIDAAKTRLAVQDSPIVDLAIELGFSDQSHFTRMFRHYTGLTPAAWRREQQVRQ